MEKYLPKVLRRNARAQQSTSNTQIGLNRVGNDVLDDERITLSADSASGVREKRVLIQPPEQPVELVSIWPAFDLEDSHDRLGDAVFLGEGDLRTAQGSAQLLEVPCRFSGLGVDQRPEPLRPSGATAGVV